MKSKSLQGFTLIELSISLVIIGIIIGGLVFGKSLIMNSKLQTVMTDVDNYTSAVVNFKQAYQSLPGDYSNAATLWGTDSVGCPAGGGTSGTCNGNGDGQLTNTNSAGQVGETFLFWQHLNKAGMFMKSLGNQSGAGGVYESVIETNVPASSVRGGGFSVIWKGNVTVASSDPDFPVGYYGNVIQFGAAVSGSYTRGAILTPEQAQSIDSKIDDGVPSSGKVRAYINGSAVTPNCVNGSSAYNMGLSNSTQQLCSLVFVMGF